MTISNVQQLHDLAETSLAAYASIQNDANLASNISNPNADGDFVTPQASASLTNTDSEASKTTSA